MYKANVQANQIAFFCSHHDLAQDAYNRFTKRYGNCQLNEASVVVCLGGDGFMLETLHMVLTYHIPVYGINCGSVGFLMNPMPSEEGLIDCLIEAHSTTLHPLRMSAISFSGHTHEALALNEVYLYRQTRQAAKIRINIDSRNRLDALIADGILIATPVGSTAYNLSINGPIIPLSAHLLSLAPISAFRPRRWRGALIPGGSIVNLEILEAIKRPVSAVADSVEFRDIVSVHVEEDRTLETILLFNPDYNLSERITMEQFRS